MVGLPARGKTYIAKKMARYLRWLGYHTQVFNLGNYRRAQGQAHVPHSFFSTHNPDGLESRKHIAKQALDDLLAFFGQGGQAAIYDGTNSTPERRKFVSDYLAASDYQGELMWVECICNDPTIVESNILDVKLKSPDYIGLDKEAAVADFKKRIQHYESTYSSVQDDELGPDDSYIKLIDSGQKAQTNNIRGYLPSRMVFFLMNLQITRRTIYFSRHGQSQYNVQGRLGGNSPLSCKGEQYAAKLGEFMANEPNIDISSLRIWCSTLERTIQTATIAQSKLPGSRPIVKWRALTEINAGVYDGFTYQQVEGVDPEGFKARALDKLNYKYPQGESYKDVIDRVERVIFEIERSTQPVLVVAHQAVLRCLYGYFLDHPLKQIPVLDVPLHTIVKITPTAYGCDEESIPLYPSEEAPHSSAP